MRLLSIALSATFLCATIFLASFFACKFGLLLWVELRLHDARLWKIRKVWNQCLNIFSNNFWSGIIHAREAHCLIRNETCTPDTSLPLLLLLSLEVPWRLVMTYLHNEKPDYLAEWCCKAVYLESITALKYLIYSMLYYLQTQQQEWVWGGVKFLGYISDLKNNIDWIEKITWQTDSINSLEPFSTKGNNLLRKIKGKAPGHLFPYWFLYFLSIHYTRKRFLTKSEAATQGFKSVKTVWR